MIVSTMKLFKFDYDDDWGQEIDLSLFIINYRSLLHFTFEWSEYGIQEFDVGINLTPYKGLTFELSFYKLYLGLSIWSKT